MDKSMASDQLAVLNGKVAELIKASSPPAPSTSTGYVPPPTGFQPAYAPRVQPQQVYGAYPPRPNYMPVSYPGMYGPPNY